MASLFERLDGEESLIRQRVEDLRSQLAAAEERLTHLTIAREILATLPEEPGPAPAGGDGPVAVTVDAVVGVPSTGPSPPAVSAPAGARASGPRELNPANEQVMVMMVSAGRPMRAREVTLALGQPQGHRQVETMRTRLKRLVNAGWLAEIDRGVFAIASGINGHPARLGAAPTR